MTIILQSEITLDAALLEEYETHPNGCSLRLVKQEDVRYYIEFGCVGVYPSRLLCEFIENRGLHHNPFDEIYQITQGQPRNRRLISGRVDPGTILELLKRCPCSQCGGALFFSGLAA